MISAIRRNWFAIAFLAIVASCYFVASTDSWASPRSLELGLLFDLTLFAPFLYWLCYRKQETHFKIVLRMIAVAGLGVFVGKQLVPEPHQYVLGVLGWLKTGGLFIALFVEMFLAIAVFKLLFGSTDDAMVEQELIKKYAIPEWLARFMVWEANFWRSVLKWITGGK